MSSPYNFLPNTIKFIVCMSQDLIVQIEGAPQSFDGILGALQVVLSLFQELETKCEFYETILTAEKSQAYRERLPETILKIRRDLRTLSNELLTSRFSTSPLSAVEHELQSRRLEDLRRQLQLSLGSLQLMLQTLLLAYHQPELSRQEEFSTESIRLARILLGDIQGEGRTVPTSMKEGDSIQMPESSSDGLRSIIYTPPDSLIGDWQHAGQEISTSGSASVETSAASQALQGANIKPFKGPTMRHTETLNSTASSDDSPSEEAKAKLSTAGNTTVGRRKRKRRRKPEINTDWLDRLLDEQQGAASLSSKPDETRRPNRNENNTSVSRTAEVWDQESFTDASHRSSIALDLKELENRVRKAENSLQEMANTVGRATTSLSVNETKNSDKIYKRLSQTEIELRQLGFEYRVLVICIYIIGIAAVIVYLISCVKAGLRHLDRLDISSQRAI